MFLSPRCCSSSPQDKWDIQKTGSLNPYVNAYGLMRSPWNNNPSPYIGRHNTTYGVATTTMPDCGVMSSCYGSKSLSGTVWTDGLMDG